MIINDKVVFAPDVFMEGGERDKEKNILLVLDGGVHQLDYFLANGFTADYICCDMSRVPEYEALFMSPTIVIFIVSMLGTNLRLLAKNLAILGEFPEVESVVFSNRVLGEFPKDYYFYDTDVLYGNCAYLPKGVKFTSLKKKDWVRGEGGRKGYFSAYFPYVCEPDDVRVAYLSVGKGELDYDEEGLRIEGYLK